MKRCTCAEDFDARPVSDPLAVASDDAARVRAAARRAAPLWRTPSRRGFLASAAVVLGLPLLESLLEKTAWAAPAPRQRFVAFYVPCGIHMANWTPSEVGKDFALPPILKPLAPIRSKVLVVSGLANAPARPDGPGDHAAGTGSFLTCAHVFKTEGANIKNGVSADQVIAGHVGTETRIASLQLGIDGGSGVGGCDSGYSCAYARNVSWANASEPLPKTVHPHVVFDRLFTGLEPGVTVAERERRRKQQTSVLDYVLDDAKSVRTHLGSRDRHKLDEYLAAVRDVEQRANRSFMLPQSPIARPPENLPYPEHVRTMLDLMVLGLQTDSTRVATFMIGNAGSGRSYDFIGVSGGHHQISHHQNLQENFDKLTRIDTWEIEQLAYLLQKMDAVDEGGHTLLDSSAVFLSSEIEDGNTHSHFNMPVLLAGTLDGRLPTGRHARVADKTPFANLFMTVFSGFGIRVDRFGDDGTAPLELPGMGAEPTLGRYWQRPVST